MGRGRTVTLKGAAAGAFVEMMRGSQAKTDEDKCIRIATVVHMHMKSGDEGKATALVKHLAEHGLDATVRILVR